MDFASKLFQSQDFMPHGHCYLWRPDILWLNAVSDATIALAYYCIPFFLVYLVKKRRDLPFNWAFILFSLFILACGTTHVMGIVTIWNPLYRLDGIIKAVTGLLSMATAIAVFPLLPKVLALPSPRQLREANERLQEEIEERKRIEQSLEDQAKELRRLNDQLREHDRYKDEFFANVSHELRTPLTLILAPLETALQTTKDERQTQSLVVVRNNTLRLLQLVNGLLDFSRLQAGKVVAKREALDAADLVRSILQDFRPHAERHSLAFKFHSNVEATLFMVDRYLYERIVFNLIGNAIKFSPQGGIIDISLMLTDEKLILTVADPGLGIAAEDIPRIFHKFHQIEGTSTRRFEGTGLGLAMVKEFSELMGGDAHVESVLGQGSKFFVTIPAELAPSGSVGQEARTLMVSQPAPLRREVSEAMIGARSGTGKKVLVAEDNFELALYIQATLAKICEVRLAGNGENALEIAREWHPDLILSDVMMPKMDGVELCKAIRGSTEFRETAVILLTALTHREALLRGWEAGADDYLFKPFHPEELLVRVRSILLVADTRKKWMEEQGRAERERSAREVSERNLERLRRIEEELRRVDKIKDEFLATVSHELRTPMNAIIGWSELLKDRNLNPDHANKALDVINRNARAQAQLVEDLLDISRIMTGKLQLQRKSVSLADVVSEAVESLRLAGNVKQIELEVILDRTVGPVLGDPERLQQVIWNLLSNAIKFTTKQGHVRIELLKHDSRAEVVVKDDGEGIDPDFLPHMFERFLQEDQSNTRRFGGLGLGLSIVRYIVELHGGSVRAESLGKGHGAVLRVSLPLIPVLQAENFLEDVNFSKEEESRRMQSMALSKKVIYVVEDETDGRELISAILRTQGAEVESFNNARSAFDRIKQRKPDALVSDIGMPEFSGFDLIQWVRAWGSETSVDLPAIALTAYARSDQREQALEAGFDMHLPKPVDAMFLVQSLLKIMSNRQT